MPNEEEKDNDDNNNDDNNNDDYRDLEKAIKEAFEAIESESKEGGLSDKDTLLEYISFMGEQRKHALLRLNATLRVYMPLIVSNEDVRRKVVKMVNEMQQSIEHSLAESIRMREELLLRRRRKKIEEKKEEEEEEGRI